jgi:creatinine deaminase
MSEVLSKIYSENKTFLGGEEYLKQRGVEVVVLDNPECKELMDKFIAKNPSEWYFYNFSLSIQHKILTRA